MKSNSKKLLIVAAFVLFCSHNLYLKLETYFLWPNQEATVSLYNGTFEKSENIITRDRIIDASIVGLGERNAIDPTAWTDLDSTITQLPFNTGDEGTYVIGVSTKPRTIELTADKFNSYLEHDGVLDELERRTKNSLLAEDAVESYEKHVKAIYQVGDARTADWNTNLGYPIEFIPQENPYEKYSGNSIDLLLLLDGEPLTNQLVFADHIHGIHEHTGDDHHHNHDHGHDHDHAHDDHSHDHEGHDHSHEAHSHDNHAHDNHEHSHDEHSHEGHEHKHEEHDHSHDGHSHDDHDHEHEAHSHDGHDHDHEEDGHKHDAEEEHTHDFAQQLRTNEKGIVTIDLPHDGIYFIRTINMVAATDSEEFTHISKWATLTFEVTHKHTAGEHAHDHHDHEEGIPTWIFVLGSLILIAILFLVFRKKTDEAFQF